MKSKRQRLLMLSMFLIALGLDFIFPSVSRLSVPTLPSQNLATQTRTFQKRYVPAFSLQVPSAPTHSITSSGQQGTSKFSKEEPNKEELNLPAHALRAANKTLGFPARGIPVLMYHSIKFLPGNSLGVPPEQFAEEMDYLYTHGYRTISLDDLNNLLRDPYSTAMPPQPIVLTFDDGYADNYQTAWPIMQRYGFVGTFFVVTSSVGSGMMTWDDLKDLVRHGNSIGSHSVHHYDLTTISPVLLQKELVESKAAIDKELGTSVFAFCYPSGRYNEETQKMLIRTGYTLAFTTEHGKVTSSANPLALKRVRIPGGLSLQGFAKLIN